MRVLLVALVSMILSVGATDENSPILFVHMHKAAGSTICKLAQQHLHITQYQVEHNCNQDGDGPNITPHGSIGKTCAIRMQEVQHANIGFFGVERFADMSGALCPHFRHITVLRDPLERLASHANFETTSENMKIPPLSTALKRFPGARKVNGQRLKQHWCYWSVSTLNNYYIRTLLGHDVYMMPLEAITAEHLATAKSRLDDFEAVLITERWSESMALLEKKFGWKEKELTNRAAKKHDHGAFHSYFSAEDAARLTELNILDHDLYDYGHVLLDKVLKENGIPKQ